MERKDGPRAPFEVVGLQQAWREEGLALYACLVAPEEPSAQSCPRSQEPAVSSSICTWSCAGRAGSTALSTRPACASSNSSRARAAQAGLGEQPSAVELRDCSQLIASLSCAQLCCI